MQLKNWISQFIGKGQRWPNCTHNDLLGLRAGDNEAADQDIVSGLDAQARGNIGQSRRNETTKFKRADVAYTIAQVAALICRGSQRVVARVDRGAGAEERMRVSGTAVVLQRVELRNLWRTGGSNLIAAHVVSETGAEPDVADEVMTVGRKVTTHVWIGRRTGQRAIAGNDGIAEVILLGAAFGVIAATAVAAGGPIAGGEAACDRAVAQQGAANAIGEPGNNTATLYGRVVRESAISRT